MKKKDEILRHSAAHLLAHAIYRLYPDTLFGIGPATKSGFFYDIVKKEGSFKNEDLKKITEEMHKIVSQDYLIEHTLAKKDEGRKMFKNNPFKMDIIENQITEDQVGIATQGEFVDLCKGGHVQSTGLLGSFVLTGISGSYWRACREGTPMQRISGVVFETKQELEEYLETQKNLEKYDHRTLGKKMDLFGLHEEGPGFPFLYPKGMAVINSLIDFMKKITKYHGYKEIKTPTILNQDLWKKSGHFEHYKDHMYFTECDDVMYSVKPMNCPGAFITYNSKPRSYRELPLRLAEFGYVHRFELSGVLHGLTRVRAFTIDDAHIFCLPSQIKSEVSLVFSLIKKVMHEAGLKISKVVLATKPVNAAGNDQIWEKAISALKSSLEEEGQKYEIDEGAGAFYGPKIGVEMTDTFGRIWSCGTIQLDFVQPENFNLMCVNSEGKNERVVVIHQAIFGSLERFFAICLEHHKGKLPFMMAPVQVRIIAISQDQINYAKKIYKKLLLNGFRVEFDEHSSDPLNAKLQSSISDHECISIIVGKKELEKGTISARYNYTNIQKNNISLDDFIFDLCKLLPKVE